VTRAVATLTELLHGYLTRDPREKAVGHATAGGGTAWLSTAELADRIRALSLGLMARGVQPGDRVALLSENRWEWMVSDFAILAAGAVNVPVHPGLSAGQMAYILGDSEARAALVSTRSLAATLMEARRDVPGLDTVIAFDETPANGSGLFPLARAMEEGRAHGEAHPGAYRRTRDAVEPGDLASLIYTSGTTGDPKGVMLTHGNFASNVTSCCSVFQFTASDLALSFLPLCHVFERTVDYCYYHSGCAVAHLPDLTRVAESFAQFRPTVFTAVPRLYEKMYARIVEQVPPSRKRLFDWAVEAGTRTLRRRLAGRPVGPWLRAQRLLADRLVFRKIRDRLGGRIRFSISGGAPLDRGLAEFFLGAGIQVLEGYGLTETSPVIASNTLNRPKPGTVGPPLPGVEVRIAEDGEVLTRGALVMKGYWKSPELTARTIDADGWLSTGDIGSLDEDGYLSITDRKKEIIVTAQGKNVAPQPLENALKRAPLINQVAVVGDRRPYLVALVVPDFDLLKRLGAKLETGAASRAEQVRHPAVISAVNEEIRKATERFAHHEQIHRFLLLDRELSQEAGELTPTLKLKRRVIQKTFADAIEALYEGHGTPRPRQS
jgi:long-chain acyl-CoA synthetase